MLYTYYLIFLKRKYVYTEEKFLFLSFDFGVKRTIVHLSIISNTRTDAVVDRVWLYTRSIINYMDLSPVFDKLFSIAIYTYISDKAP